MSNQQWEWKCSACNEVFRGGTKEVVEGQFLTHAREKHNPKVLLSFDTTEKGTK